MYAPPDKADVATTGMSDRCLERHMLVWLDDAGWDTAQANTEARPKTAFRSWRGQDWPLIVRRADTDAQADEICLGLPLPPDEDSGAKLRVSLRAHARHIKKTTPAITLAEALRTLSGPWRAPLAALQRDATDLHLRVYGSLAMEALTGLPYVAPTSDVDLLFHPSSRRQLEHGIAVLSRHAALLPLDGEIVFPGGAAVAWKEWLLATTNPAKVMVKELHTVRLADTASLLALLEPS